LVEKPIIDKKPVKDNSTTFVKSRNVEKVESVLLNYFKKTFSALDSIFDKLINKKSVGDDLTEIMSFYLSLKNSNTFYKLSDESVSIFENYAKEFISFYNDLRTNFIPKFLS